MTYLFKRVMTIIGHLRPYWHRHREEEVTLTYAAAEAKRREIAARRAALERERELIQRRRQEGEARP